MTPMAKRYLSEATIAGQLLTPRINNALIRARHRADGDADRIAQITAALAAAAELVERIQRAKLALLKDRREAEP